MTIAPLFKRIVLLEYRLGDGQFWATGSFFSHNDEIYLATNSHVFEHELGVSPEHLTLMFWDGMERISVTSDEGCPNWHNHENSEVDLSLLPLSNYDLKQHDIGTFSKEDFYQPDSDRTKVGRDAMVVGYPSPGDTPIRNDENSDPVAVDAMISSEYGSSFDRQPFFLIDADTYDGMSGSPVVILPGPDFSVSPGDSWSGDSTFFLGIHSGPYEELDELDLNRVWYPDLLTEIAESIC